MFLEIIRKNSLLLVCGYVKHLRARISVTKSFALNTTLDYSNVRGGVENKDMKNTPDDPLGDD